MTPLHEAAMVAAGTGNLKILRLLLQYGANPDRRGMLPNGEPLPISSCQMMKLVSIEHAQEQDQDSNFAERHSRIQNVINLLSHYSKHCKDFDPNEYFNENA